LILLSKNSQNGTLLASLFHKYIKSPDTQGVVAKNVNFLA